MNADRITPENFRPYGTVASLPQGAPLAADNTFKFWSDVADFEIDGETEIGFCTVFRNDRVDWMERHDRTPEVIIPIDGPVVLPVMTQDEHVAAFRVDVGEAAVIGRGVWHSACKPVDGDESTYFVIFRRGTPAEDVQKTEIEPIVIERHG